MQLTPEDYFYSSGFFMHVVCVDEKDEKLNQQLQIKSNQIKFICDTNQNITECDIIIRQMCRQDTKAVSTALTGALGSKSTNYNSK